MYKTNELWEQALAYHGSLISRGSIEEQADAHGIIIRKTGLGFEFRTYHTGGDYFDKLPYEHELTLRRLGFAEGSRHVARLYLEEKLERLSKRLKPSNEVIQSIQKKLCQLQNQSK